jgi:hypothetical protein
MIEIVRIRPTSRREQGVRHRVGLKAVRGRWPVLLLAFLLHAVVTAEQPGGVAARAYHGRRSEREEAAMPAITDVSFIEMRIAKAVGFGPPLAEPPFQCVVLDEVSGDRHVVFEIGCRGDGRFR